jgi:hypothetical protein
MSDCMSKVSACNSDRIRQGKTGLLEGQRIVSGMRRQIYNNKRQ